MKSHKIISLSFSLLVVMLFISCNETNDLNNEIEEFENGLKHGTILERMEAWDIRGISISLVYEGEVRWSKGYGTANTINGSQVNTETIFQAGSISKPISALGVLKLIEEGHIGLDDDINPYLKKWKLPYDNIITPAEKITIRQLLTHTSGLAGDGGWDYKQEEKLPTIESELNGLGKHGKLEFLYKPGEKFEYSNGGFSVLEILIEDISGLPFEKYMEKIILKPLGMNNSTFVQPLPLDFHHNASAGYDHTGQITEGLWLNSNMKAAGGLWTTATDLAKYCIEIQEILAGKSDGILSNETINEMLSKQTDDFGLGFQLGGEGDFLGFSHSGHTESGFSNQLISLPYKGVSAIILTNSEKGSGLIDEIFESFSEIYVIE